MRFYRNLLNYIEPQLTTREIIVITGMRRVGKTTLLQMIYEKIDCKNKVFLDIENILEQKIFEEIDFNNIWANLKAFGITNKEKAFIFLDEIQAMPGIVKAIKYLYDHYDVKFIVTGSSSFYLKNYFPESLSGRKVIFELFPLDFDEFLLFKGVEKEKYKCFKDKNKNKNYISFQKFDKLYQEYLKFGGFPQVVLAEDELQKKLYLKDIFTSYFEMDVRRMADFRQINAFRDLLLLLLQRVGSKLAITKLASEIGISRETVYSYLSFLEGTYFIFLLSPFSRNVDREMICPLTYDEVIKIEKNPFGILHSSVLKKIKSKETKKRKSGYEGDPNWEYMEFRRQLGSGEYDGIYKYVPYKYSLDKTCVWIGRRPNGRWIPEKRFEDIRRRNLKLPKW